MEQVSDLPYFNTQPMACDTQLAFGGNCPGGIVRVDVRIIMQNYKFGQPRLTHKHTLSGGQTVISVSPLSY